MAVIDLTRDPGPSVQESTGNINRVLDLTGERELLRQQRNQLNDFVAETIRLEAENAKLPPESQISSDLITRQAALNITQKDPEFDPGIPGLFQRFASGLSPGPSTALTGPIAESLLSEPTGIRREAIKAQIESTRALGAQRAGVGVAKPSPQETQFDKDLGTLNSIKSTSSQLQRAKARVSASGLLIDLSSLDDQKEVSDEFSRIFFGDEEEDRKGLEDVKGLKIDVPGGVFNKMFGEKAFNRGLKDAEDQALKDGIDPESVRPVFEVWWDEQAKASGRQREFQPRAEFQEIETEPSGPKPQFPGQTPRDIRVPSAARRGTEDIDTLLKSDPNDVDFEGLSPEVLDKLIKAAGRQKATKAR